MCGTWVQTTKLEQTWPPDFVCFSNQTSWEQVIAKWLRRQTWYSGWIFLARRPAPSFWKKNYLCVFNCSHMKSRNQNCNGKFGKKNTQSNANIGRVCPSLPKWQVGVVVPLKWVLRWKSGTKIDIWIIYLCPILS